MLDFGELATVALSSLCPGKDPQRWNSLRGQAAGQGSSPEGQSHEDQRGTQRHDHRRRRRQRDETGTVPTVTTAIEKVTSVHFRVKGQMKRMEARNT